MKKERIKELNKEVEQLEFMESNLEQLKNCGDGMMTVTTCNPTGIDRDLKMSDEMSDVLKAVMQDYYAGKIANVYHKLDKIKEKGRDV